MMKTRTNLIVALFALCFTGTVSDAYAWGWHKRKSVKNDSVVTSESKYDELVKKAKTRGIYLFFRRTRESENPCDSCVSGCDLKDMMEKKRQECGVKKKSTKKNCCG